MGTTRTYFGVASRLKLALSRVCFGLGVEGGQCDRKFGMGMAGAVRVYTCMHGWGLEKRVGGCILEGLMVLDHVSA